MASIFKRDGAWIVKWCDGNGRWRQRRTACRTKEMAKQLAVDLEAKAERQQEGLEPRPGQLPRMTFGELLDWWWKEYGSKLRSSTPGPFANKHLRPAFGELSLSEVTPARIEGLLQAKTDKLKPKSLNYLRGLIHRIFGLALRRGLWMGINPATAVERRKVTKRLPEYLRLHEVAPTLLALDAHWRPLFATALYTGMRQGELLGLRKRDVDLDAGTLSVCRSYDQETTKDSRQDLLPIAAALRPYLDAAVRSSPSELVFPKPDGAMQPRDLKLDHVLRRAMGRADIVLGYRHVCRRKGCGFKVEKSTPEPGRCPDCDMRLWPVAIPRHVRFHDLRHTTATLLLKEGVPLAVVQRILRHSDPRLTAMIYGHLDIADMRKAVDQLRFQDEKTRPHGAPVVRPQRVIKNKGRSPMDFSYEAAAFQWSGRQDSNLRPLGPESMPDETPQGANPSQSTPCRRDSGSFQRAVGAPDSNPLPSAALIPLPNVDSRVDGFRVLSSGLGSLLSVREVALRLSVSTATVYALVGQGKLPCVRVSNAIRVRPEDLVTYLKR